MQIVKTAIEKAILSSTIPIKILKKRIVMTKGWSINSITLGARKNTKKIQTKMRSTLNSIIGGICRGARRWTMMMMTDFDCPIYYIKCAYININSYINTSMSLGWEKWSILLFSIVALPACLDSDWPCFLVQVWFGVLKLNASIVFYFVLENILSIIKRCYLLISYFLCC